MTLSANCDETLKNAEKVNELMSEENVEGDEETEKEENHDES